MKKIIVMFFAACLLASCGSKNEKNGRDVIHIAYSDALQEQINLNNKIGQSIAKGDFASFRPDVDSCLAVLDRQAALIRDIDVQGEDQMLKQSVLATIGSFKELAETGRRFNELTVNSTEQEYNDLISRFNELATDEIPAKIEEVSKYK
jgi:hypothetical protein